MSDAPLFTIVTPTHNRRGDLERTICSVLDQQYEGVEHVVVDLGSSDGTAEMARLYGDCVSYRAVEAGTAPAEAINAALRGASGDYLAVLPAGDVYLPFALQEAAREGAGQAWLMGRSVRMNERLASTAPLPVDGRGCLSALLKHEVDPAPLSTCFIGRDVVATEGLFDASLLCAFGFEYQCRLLARGRKCRVIGRPLVAHCSAEADGPLATLAGGMEMVLVAYRYAEALHMSERADVWRTCAQRRRVFALAAAELQRGWRSTLATQRQAEHVTVEHLRRLLLGGGDAAAAA